MSIVAPRDAGMRPSTGVAFRLSCLPGATAAVVIRAFGVSTISPLDSQTDGSFSSLRNLHSKKRFLFALECIEFSQAHE